MKRARNRFQAAQKLASLPEPIAPHLDKLLNPSKSVQQVLDSLDEQYRRKKPRPAVWFLPLSEPISLHLDKLWGPLPQEK